MTLPILLTAIFLLEVHSKIPAFLIAELVYTETQTTLNMPRNINWDTLSHVYEFQPSNYEELLSVKGVGPATVRGLALVAELVYGEEPSWEDPVKFSFAYGGKDGVPYPVNREAMDESIEILRQSVQEAKIGDKEKLLSLKRLKLITCGLGMATFSMATTSTAIATNHLWATRSLSNF